MNHKLPGSIRFESSPMRFHSRIASIEGQVGVSTGCRRAEPRWQDPCPASRNAPPGPSLRGTFVAPPIPSADPLDPLSQPLSNTSPSPPLPALAQRVTLERALPIGLRAAFAPALVRQAATMQEVGVEGFTMKFRHERYGGHHLVSCFALLSLSTGNICRRERRECAGGGRGALLRGEPSPARPASLRS